MRSWWWKILRIWFAGDGWLTYTIGDLPLKSLERYPRYAVFLKKMRLPV